jgi:hypothetical protein
MHVDSMEVAEGCRSAALDLLDGIRRGYWKRELAHWLVGPYRELTLVSLSREERAWAEVVPHSHRRPAVPIDGRLQEVMMRAHDLVLTALARFSDRSDAGVFATRALARGAVIPFVDDFGEDGFAPVDLPGMRLVERVMSLVAADFLRRPHDYEMACTVCNVCATVVFDPNSRESGACAVHAPEQMRPRHQSGIEIQRPLVRASAPPPSLRSLRRQTG